MKKENKKTDYKMFQQMRQAISLKDFLKRIVVQGEEELFAEVEAIHYYNNTTYIFEIKKGKRWEYDSFQTTKKRYVFFLNGDILVEGDKLEEVEPAAFKHFKD